MNGKRLILTLAGLAGAFAAFEIFASTTMWPSHCDVMRGVYDYSASRNGYASFGEILESEYLFRENRAHSHCDATIRYPGPTGDKAAFFSIDYGFTGSVGEVRTMSLVSITDLDHATHQALNCDA